MRTMRILAFVVVGTLATTALGCGQATPEPTPSGQHGDAGALPESGDRDAAESVDVTSDAAVAVFADDGSGFTGHASDGGPCHPNFASGVNVAWIRFASDVPGPNLPAFRALFQNIRAAGGRVARWWFHTNGTKTPGYDSSGMPQRISDANVTDVKSILDTAHAAGVMVTISLWSFDMLKGNLPAGTLANNVKLLTVDANRQAYIDNVLTPLVMALKAHPGLYAWETFNEPEGMASGQSWKPFTGTRASDGGVATGQSVDESYIQKTVNWFAAAIHTADPSALVTNGTWEFQANANVGGMTNYYSNSALQNAGGKSNGILDFYEVHYYSADGARYSPFASPASHWGLDKPVVIGEFYALSQDGVAAVDTYMNLHSNGYGGGWAWQYQNSDGTNPSNGGQQTTWPAMQQPIQTLYMAAPSDIDCP